MASLIDEETGQVLWNDLLLADNFARRAVGLLGKKSLESDQAILIRPCSSIHTIGMRMTIGVAFCDADGNVLRVTPAVRPWRLQFGPRGSKFVIEWSSDHSPMIDVGQRVRVVNRP